MRPSITTWGRDHWSVLAYIETVCVDRKGVPDRSRMRCNPELHPGLAFVEPASGEVLDGSPYPTRLKGGDTLEGHDDWSCVEDLEAFGLVVWEGTGIHPVFRLTPLGRRIAAELRAHRAEGGTFHAFGPKTSLEQLPKNACRACFKGRIIESEDGKWWECDHCGMNPKKALAVIFG